MNFRPHQIQKSNALFEVLYRYNIAYLAGVPRSGKTLTALRTAELFTTGAVLVITKKKAISSIEDDYQKFGFSFDLEVINYASVHKVKNKTPDLIIYDEAHCIGSFPKSAKKTKLIKKMFSTVPCILMTGTPAIESYSQFYHQFWISKHSPFNQYTNFYKWANNYVNKKKRYFGTHQVTDYSDAKEDKISKVIEPYIVRINRDDAGLETNVNEHIIKIDLPKKLKNLSSMLIENRIIIGKTGYIDASQPAALQQKTHQILNGSVIIQDDKGNRNTVILSHYKAKAIEKHFKNKKLVIVYYYKGERDILFDYFKENITDELEVFNNSGKHIAVQYSTTEGMNLSKADAIVYYNVGFSGKDYVQSRDRLTIKGRKKNNVYFIVEENGITGKILSMIRNKKNYNKATFEKQFLR